MRYTISYLLYWLGDLVSKLLTVYSDDRYSIATRWVAVWYPVYNNLMRWSIFVQGDGTGPWKAVKKEGLSPEQQPEGAQKP